MGGLVRVATLIDKAVRGIWLPAPQTGGSVLQAPLPCHTALRFYSSDTRPASSAYSKELSAIPGQRNLCFARATTGSGQPNEVHQPNTLTPTGVYAPTKSVRPAGKLRRERLPCSSPRHPAPNVHTQRHISQHPRVTLAQGDVHTEPRF